MKALFITGIGTGVGKTIWSAIVTEALHADYWKPVQAGFEDGTDSLMVSSLISNADTRIHPELYKLKLPASPHLSAREENLQIDLEKIRLGYENLDSANNICVIEGAGGLMVPLNDREFVIDLVKALGATVLLVSRNYLGSINHSLLTARVLEQHKIPVAGWLFNDRFMDYENELVGWTGIPNLGSIPYTDHVSKEFVKEQALTLEPVLRKIL
ncbi:MAG TPA: dethiobiotin synthase [Chitinophagaceae bacterium]|nr:dethiobiotin synthase [Chitinophagaceae bacterium]